jgi:hypothetical protein
MKSIAILVILLLPLPAMAFEPWDSTDKTLFAVAALATIADGITTYNTLKNGGCERNPALPDHPRASSVAAYCAAGILAQYIVADILPSTWRKAFLSCSAAVEIGFTVHNGMECRLSF